MKLGISQKRALMSAPVLLASASCVPTAVGLQASAAPVPGFQFAEVAAPAPVPTPEWAKLEPGMPYRLLAPAVAPAQPFAAEARSEDDWTRSLECLSKAIYYEARSESEDGQRAVAQVILNRVRHRVFPNSICGVVYQGSHLRTGCQFTFTCDGSLRYPAFGPGLARARRIAADALAGEVYAPVGTATHYHTTAILPYWASSLTRAAVVGAHVFYRWRGSEGAPGAFSQSYAASEPGVAGSAPSFQPVPAVIRTAEVVESGVRRWTSATPEVRIHRGTGPAAAPAEEAEVTAVAAVAAAAAAAEPASGEFGVQVHRGEASLPTS